MTPPGVGELLTDWRFDPWLAALLALTVVAYGAGVVRVNRSGRRRWPAQRTAAFAAGMMALAFAMQSGIATYDGDLLPVHMVQHLLLTMVAAALLVASAPVSLALRALRGSPRAMIASIIRSRPARALTHPAVAWPIFTGVMVAMHVPAVYDLAVEQPWFHAVQHALFFWSAVLFWLPVVAADPVPHRLPAAGSVAYMLMAMVPMSVIGVALLVTDTVIYTSYLEPAAQMGISALDEQHAGGAIMWVGSALPMIVAIVVSAWAGLMAEERRARARERHDDMRAAAKRAEALKRGGALV